jgi:chlorobactene glucosyltransferase
MENEWIFFILSSAAMLAGIAVTYWLHNFHRLSLQVEPGLASVPQPAPFISVILPARNEARNIRRSVEALLCQTYPNYELIVVDDRSSDGTGAILEELHSAANLVARRMQVLHGADLPAGWAGKPHALVQGVKAAGGEWLCFIDADTFAEPALLAGAYQAAIQHRADLFTILTYQELGSFWEKVILPLVFTALAFGFPADKVNDPDQPEAIANGQFILIRREVYERSGGHTLIRGRIDEDKALAEQVKRAGYRLIVADGRAVARTRMYTSLPEIWEGWTKNIYLGLRDRLWLLLFGAVMGLIAALLLPVWLVGGIVWAASGGGAAAMAVAGGAGVLWIYLIVTRIQASRAMHISSLYAFTLPLGALLFTAMMGASAFKVLSGRGVSWKGRVYTG